MENNTLLESIDSEPFVYNNAQDYPHNMRLATRQTDRYVDGVFTNNFVPALVPPLQILSVDVQELNTSVVIPINNTTELYGGPEHLGSLYGSPRCSTINGTPIRSFRAIASIEQEKEHLIMADDKRRRFLIPSN